MTWTREEKKVWTAILFLGCSAVYSARTSMPVCVTKVAQQYSWSKSESGAVLSSFFWGYTLSQVAGGYVADKFGGERVVMFAAVAWGACTLITPLVLMTIASPALAMAALLGVRTVMGVAQGVHYPAISSITAKHVSQEERSLIYGTICAGSHFGTLLTGSIGSVILENVNWQSVFYLCGSLGILWAAILNFCLLKQPSSSTLLLDDVDDVKQSEEMKVPWGVLFRAPAFWSTLFGHVCKNCAFYLLLSWLPFFFHQKFPSAKSWIYNVVPWIAVMPACSLGGYLANVMIRNRVTVTATRKINETVALLGCALFLACLRFTESSFPAALFFVSAAISVNGFHNSGILVNPQDIAPKYAGSVFGAMNMAGSVPGIIGVYTTGLVLDSSGGNWQQVFNTTGVVLAFGWLGFVLFGTARKIVD